MPRYYCDYCDTYLTHDSPSVRKQHNSGYKHKANIRTYYQNFEEQQTQILIDQKIKQHHGQAAAYGQIGAAYNQHLASYQGIRPRLPLIPPPMFPLPPGAVHPHMAQGYGTAPMGASATMQPLPAPPFPHPHPQQMKMPALTTSAPPLANHTDNVAALGSGSYPYAQASQTSH